MIVFFLNRTIIVPVLVCGLLASYSEASIQLNEKWTQNSNGLWSVSITPRGTFDKKMTASATCYDTGPDSACRGDWTISIKGGAGSVYTICSPTVTIPKGTNYFSAISLMERQTLGITCTLSNFPLNGNETICIYSHASGGWREGGTSYPLGIDFYGRSYCSSGEEGGVSPPVPPTNCVIDNILFDHGTLNSSEVNGAIVRLNRKIRCTQKTSVILSIPNRGVILLNNKGTIHSNITINGGAGSKQVYVDGETDIEFISTLASSESGLNGNFRNSAVLSIEIL